MSDPNELEKLNREIAVIAAHIARHQDLIEQMRAEGIGQEVPDVVSGNNRLPQETGK